MAEIMQAEEKKYRISTVIPAYNEEDSVAELCRLLTGSLAGCQKVRDYELIFVDDGSTDATGERLTVLAASDPHVRVVTFEKNRGKSEALMAGFAEASGELIFTIDADLQDDPAEIPRFLERLEEGYDLVSGWKENRQDPLEKRLPSKLFNKVTSTVFRVPLHDFNCGFKLYRAEYAKKLVLDGGLYRFIPVFVSQMGGRIGELSVTHHARKYGKSKYGVKRYFVGLWDFLRIFRRVYLKKDGTAAEGARYLIVGALTTLINLGGFQVLTALGVPYRTGNLAALISCKIFAYAGNKWFVFRSRTQTFSEWALELVRYVITRGATGLLDYVLLIGAVDGLHMNQTAAKWIIQIAVIIANYILGKRIVFRKSGKGREEEHV